jgi:hypothetical protein
MVQVAKLQNSHEAISDISRRTKRTDGPSDGMKCRRLASPAAVELDREHERKIKRIKEIYAKYSYKRVIY